MFFTVGCAFAQDNDMSTTEPSPLEQLLVYENPRIYVTIGDITYTPKSAANQVVNGVVSALVSKDIPIEDESMVPMVKEAITSAVSRTLRMVPLEGAPTEEQLENSPCLKLTATITGCNVTQRLREKYMDKRILVNAYIYITNMKTGEVVGSQQVTGDAWESSFNTIEEAKRDAVHNFYVNLINRFNSWYPLRGHMLEKGFEKGKKQKLKEIYIDLGSNHNLGTGYDCNIYTVRRIAGRVARKYIGRGKVVEVLGEDISTVKLSRGADLIKQAFDNGAEIAVSVN